MEDLLILLSEITYQCLASVDFVFLILIPPSSWQVPFFSTGAYIRINFLNAKLLQLKTRKDLETCIVEQLLILL